MLRLDSFASLNASFDGGQITTRPFALAGDELLNLNNGKNAMKTTIEIHDDLLARAEQYARKTGRPLYAIVEEGLRQVLPASPSSSPYRLPDLSEGKPGASDPLKAYSWQELRGIIYGEAEEL